MSRILDKNAFGKLLLYLRNQKGLTQDKLAKELNTTKSTVSKWERGDYTPNIDIMLSIADYFLLTLDELVEPTETLKKLQQQEDPSEIKPVVPQATSNPKKKLIPLFVCIGFITIVGFILGIRYQNSKNTDTVALPCTLISQEYTVHEMYGYTLQLQYTTPTKYEKEHLKEYAIALSKEWSKNKDTEKDTKFISLSFYLENENEPYFMFGQLITPNY